jgi:hypothetical protein
VESQSPTIYDRHSQRQRGRILRHPGKERDRDDDHGRAEAGSTSSASRQRSRRTRHYFFTSIRSATDFDLKISLRARRTELVHLCSSWEGLNSFPGEAGSEAKGSPGFNKKNKKWGASIQINGKTKHLGRFSTDVEAAQARDKMALILYGKDVPLNFPIE